MHFRNTWLAAIQFTLIAAGFFWAMPAWAQQGDIRHVHDPSLIQTDGIFYLFCTGRGLPIRTSADLLNWQPGGVAFNTAPDWTKKYTNGSLWAPDISYFNGQFHLYYAASSFGKNQSAIGLATSPTLNPADANYKWVDCGKVIATTGHDNWNAIDPSVFINSDNTVWLVLGSCWSGIKLVALNPQTGLPLHSADAPLSLAARPDGKLLEEGSIIHRGHFYYLWMSFDHCCRGSASDYRIVVARSSTLPGPYSDEAGLSTLSGGGTPVLTSDGNIRGPGSCEVITAHGQDWIVMHYYDAAESGVPTLQIRRLTWGSNGWPTAGAPISSQPTTQPAATQHVQ